MKKGYLRRITDKDTQLHRIQKDFEDQIENLTVNMTMLRTQLPSNKYRLTKKFHVLPGYKVENQFQYPDMLSLSDLPLPHL